MSKLTPNPESKLQALILNIRDKALTIVRSFAINRHLWTLVDLNVALKNVGRHTAEAKKEVARIEFAISQLNAADPDYETLKKNLEEALAEAKLNITAVESSETAETAALNKEIADLNQKMLDIETGVIPIKRESIDEQVERLLENQD